MELAYDILFKDGVDWIDVEKKLKGDFNKAGDLLSIISLKNELSTIASKLFDRLPPVMQDKLLRGTDGCRCRFNIRAIRKTAELESGVCSEIQDGDKFPVAVTDVPSVIFASVTTSEVTLDHVRDQDASSFKLDSPTEMPVNLNLMADDHEVLDTTSDMDLHTRPIVQCSESNVSTSIPDVSEMERSSSTATEQITSELEATISCPHTRDVDEPLLHLDIVDKGVSLERLSSTAPEQVSSELETTCSQYFEQSDEVILNHVVVDEDISSVKTVMSKPKKQAEPLQQLKIAPRCLTSNDSFNIESVCELRRSLSLEDQETCSDAKDKVGEDGCFQQPQPPGTPPAITGLRIIKSLEPKKDMRLIQHMASHLGQGGFGSVFKAHDQDTGILLALKKIKFLKEGEDEEIMKEVYILNGLDHRNIISVLGSQVQGMECQIFLEWMAGGSVQELLNQYGPMSALVIQSYSEQVLCAVAYLHQWKILHCDIKGANILVDSTGQVAKLCDFGLAQKMPVAEGMKGQGTPPFMAPELFMGSCNSPGSDVWSVGCTMIQMATGKQPWSEFDLCACIFKICTEELPIPSSLPPLLKKAIGDCLERDVAKRPTARELQCRLAMPFLESASTSPYLHDY